MVKKKSQTEVNSINDHDVFTVLSSVKGRVVIILSSPKIKKIATPCITGAESHG
jgi:hypothetical protein